MKPEELENRAAEVAWELLDQGEREELVPAVGPALCARRRPYAEALGLLAWELEPVAPPAALKGELLTFLEAEATQEVEPLVALPFGDETQEVPPLSPLAPAAPNAGAARDDSLATVIAFPRPARWPRALAAVLALAVVGVGAWAALLYSRLGDQAGEIARLRLKLAAAEERGRELASARSDLAAVRDQFALVTSPAVEVCPLRATGEVPAAGAVRGVLFVQADHQHWYLRVHGLKPEPADQDYQLWFLVGGMPVSGGTFSVAAGQPVDLASPTMPAGTKAVAITLERRGGNYRPTSPMILYGEGLTRL